MKPTFPGAANDRLLGIRMDMLPKRKHIIPVSLNFTFHFQLHRLKKLTISSFHSAISVDLFSVLKVIFIFLLTGGSLHGSKDLSLKGKTV